MRGLISMSPRAIKSAIDDYVVAQSRAKRILSTVIHNQRLRIQQLEQYQRELLNDEREHAEKLRREAAGENSSEILTDFEGQAEGYPSVSSHAPSKLHRPWPQRKPPPLIEKTNVMLLGPTGSGKTLLVKSMAKLVDIPIAISDCTTLTQSGYVGDDVETTIHRLLSACDWSPKLAETGIVVLDEVDKLARPATLTGRDVGGEGVQQALLKLMEGTTITISEKHRPTRVRTGLGLPDTFTIDTSNMLFIFCGAFTGLDKIVEARLGKRNIGFGSHLQSNTSFFMPSSHRFSDPSEENNILNHVISEDLQKYGPEFIGRIPRIVPLHPLSENDLFRIVQEPKDSLLTQYQRLFSLNQVVLEFTNAALRQVAKRAMVGNAGQSDGARGLRRVMEEILEGPQYEVPGGSVRYVLITEDVVNGHESPLYFARDRKDDFYETLMREDEFRRKPQDTSRKFGDVGHSKSGRREQKEREAYGGIP